MFANIAKFFIENSKLTLVLVMITLISGVWSYFIIPKQYNPTIIVPAFSIIIPANWLSSSEVSRYIISPLENKIMELEGIDEVYWTAWDNYGAAMVKFKVWQDSEKAKIRLQQKLSENMGLKPIWTWEPIVTTIDPEALPQITYAISYNWEDLNIEQKYIYLRSIANLIKQELKIIENITTIDIVWWYKSDIIINLDLEKIESKNTDLMQVYDVLKKNNLNLPSGTINTEFGDKIFVWVEAKVNSIYDLKKIVVNMSWDSVVYLEDIAEIKEWVKRINKISNYNNKEAVFLWVWKTAWTNSVFLTDAVLEKVNEIKKYLPKNIELNVIQNEWDTARNATNMLLVNLAQSVLIVFLVLALYLWRKDAFNTAVSIPLTLWLVFFFALIAWENINRITLFALILVLWMLVDNSTVVVENISRHLNERANTGKTKLEAVLEGTGEVWVWVILSTVSRLLAFGAMFAVWGMMWEYMWPIPKFAIMALLISLVIAFSINPWLSFLWAKDVEEKDKIVEHKKESKYDIRKIYLDFMKKYLNNDVKSTKKRKLFKLVFWITLVVILVWPIYGGIFKARMLPKSNQDQIYVWIDAPRWWNASKMDLVKDDVLEFFSNENSNIPEELDLVKETSLTIGQAFMWDFANLFRWGLSRIWENQLSARVNLISPDEYEDLTWDDRMFSENYTINIRPLFREFILSKYPDLQVRLQEDPPWPPVRATFLAKIKTDASPENELEFIRKVQSEVWNISDEQSIVDLWNSLSTTYKKLNVKLDKESITRAWLTSEQVAYSLWIAINWLDIDLIKNDDSLEPTNLVLWVKNEQNKSIALLNRISFTNSEWQKIFLSSIADIEYSFVWSEINTDKREEANYIYWEMWDNSLIYPVIKLFWILMDDEFLNWEYEVVSWSPYNIEYIWLKDDKKYILEWWGEWELTMDTFRDLWLAMWLSLLAIYFLLVWQFASFRIAWIIMITFLLAFYGVFPGFSLLYLFKNEYFSATSMIWIIALWWIVVWNAIILLDYINVLKRNWLTIEDALLKAWYVRFAPIILTSLTTVFWAATIIWDPVWSGLAWAIIWGLFVSSILTLIVIPIFYYDSQKIDWDKCMEKDHM
jgi:multidrug efflux pump subunit AcrB